MGCPSTCEIGANLTFSVCTHDPDTGVLTDADDSPSYRLYEDETAVPILTGSMAKLDDANTVGFYAETVAVSSVNGFENNKTYTIYIEATVDSDTGGISFGFKAFSPLNDLSAADVNAEVDTALSDYGGPTKAEMDDAFTEIKGATWAGGTDTLEAIRDRGDAAWITATGFSTHSAADVWDATSAVLSLSFEVILDRLYQIEFNAMEVSEATGAVTLKTVGGAGTLATSDVDGGSGTTDRDEYSWS